MIHGRRRVLDMLMARAELIVEEQHLRLVLDQISYDFPRELLSNVSVLKLVENSLNDSPSFVPEIALVAGFHMIEYGVEYFPAESDADVRERETREHVMDDHFPNVV